MSDIENALNESLTKWHQEYANLLPKQLKEIDDTWHRYCTGGDREDMTTFHRMVHRLSGSGAHFGFAAMSEQAGALEDLIIDLMEAHSDTIPITPELRAQVAEAIEKIKKKAAKQEEPPSLEPDKGVTGPPIIASVDLYMLSQDPQHAQRLKSRFQPYGYSLHIFDTLKALKDGLTQKLPRILLVDLGREPDDFPGLRTVNGLKQELKNTCPILCFSEEGGNFDAWLQIIRSGASACFPKPCRLGTLVDKIEELTTDNSDSPYRLLVVDDDKILTDQMASIFGKTGTRVCVVSQPEELLPALEKFQPDLILMDLYLPKCSGLELVRLIRQDPAYVGVPIVCLSRETDMRRRLESLSLGADDFLSKPIKYSYLYPYLVSKIRRSRVLQARISSDHQTGLLHHGAFQEKLIAKIQRAEEKKAELVFAIIDLDKFSLMNRRHGHQVGDRVLGRLAKVLRGRLRKKDVLGRYSGGAVAVIFPETPLVRAQKIIDAIRLDFGKIIHDSPHGDVSVTFSCGMAQHPAFDSLHQLVNAAEAAVTQAKKSGGNRVTVIGPVKTESQPITPSANMGTAFIRESEPDKATIVVVDDEPPMLKIVSTFFEKKGYRVFSAATGNEGFELVLKHTPQLLITDLLLFPGIHGFELCKKVKNHPKINQTKVILMTAVYKNYRHRLEGKEAGADEFVEKPVQFPVLLEKVERLLLAQGAG